MWLDRLSHPGAGPPQNNINRSGSPLPRSVSGAGRGGPYVTSQRSARVSAQSLISSDSTTSLLTYSRRMNGSSLRQSVTVDATEDKAKDAAALALLGKLLAADDEKGSLESSATATETITDEDLELDFDFGGLSLRQIVWNGPGGLQGDDVARSTQTPEERKPFLSPSISDEVSVVSLLTGCPVETERTKLEDLHKSIRACDEVLNSVETNLTNFRNDLVLVSADIENLQARSTALNIRLENRKTVEKGLAAAVEDLSVPPALVNRIAEGNIDEQWVQSLKEVDRRAAVLRSGSEQQKQGKAVQDLLPLIDKLILKAIERIRDFLVAQVKALRSPHINAQIIQQQSFLKFRDLYTFLHKHHATLADEICLAYMNTMRWYYSNQFGRYAKSLEKLRLHVLDKNDVLGHDDLHYGSSRKGGGSSGGGGPGVRHDAFSLGRRIDLLKGPSQIALSSYLAEEDTAAHYLEVPFRHFNLALVDNATAEYTFLASFFSPALTFATIGRHFHYIFEPTFALGQALTRLLTADSYDCLGVLLCIRLNQHAAFELQRRKVPAVDSYVNATNMLLWPRFQVIMDHHCESMRQLAAAVAASPSSSSTASTAPHVITQRFGQLLHGILALSTEAGDDEPVVTSLHRLRSESEAFLTRYSQAVFGKDRRKQERFLYNNYSLVLTIISDVNGGKLAADQKQHIESLKAAFQEGA
ncbi:garp complex subunit [Grosmannia clavigera kw1407]|uniref:Garp complex subunit n=1 Tax=Grosmannia clavigera (strain kw1407 / UAMH 11150) TaxID=655863 RepID=F0X8Y4_GROCL|nr:garp complex subunit [Grosmannia clavigera kw1407]EFX05919.1 garp complex subunit [Grosmannia clavigera kw1407]